MVGNETDNPRARQLAARARGARQRRRFDDFARARLGQPAERRGPDDPGAAGRVGTRRRAGIAPARGRDFRRAGRAIARLGGAGIACRTRRPWRRRGSCSHDRAHRGRAPARRPRRMSVTDDAARRALRAARRTVEHASVCLGHAATDTSGRCPGAPIALDTTRASLAVGGAPGDLGSVFTFNASGGGRASPAPRPQRQLVREGRSSSATDPRARSILNYGQSGRSGVAALLRSGRSCTRAGEFKPAWFGRAEVEANAVRTYRVGGD